MDSPTVMSCKELLLSSDVGTSVKSLPEFGPSESHGTHDSWLSAWALCCNLPVDTDVNDLVYDCMTFGRLTRFMVSGEFRERLYLMCDSMGIGTDVFRHEGVEYPRGYANLTMSIPKGFVWVVPIFDDVKRHNKEYGVQKSFRKYEYMKDIRVMNTQYPVIRDLLLKRGDRHCSPWGRCRDTCRHCLWCSGADGIIDSLPILSRGKCIDRLVSEDVVDSQWGDGVTRREPLYIDEFA